MQLFVRDSKRESGGNAAPINIIYYGAGNQG